MRQTPIAKGQRGGPPEPVFGGELRDTKRAIQLWHRKASELGRPPPVSAFAFSETAADSYRFLICVDFLVKEDSVLILYGINFAKLFGLPDRPSMNVPIVRQIPPRYQSLFVGGCDDAVGEGMPARFSGAVAHGGDAELYRASFMPLRTQSATLQFVYGSFNCRSVRDLATGDRSTGTTEQYMELLQHGLQVE